MSNRLTAVLLSACVLPPLPPLPAAGNGAPFDAPEMKGRCAAERAAARLARENLADLIGAAVSISNIGGAKYYGRVLADVDTVDDIAVASVMLGHKLVRPYGGEKRKGWCRWRD